MAPCRPRMGGVTYHPMDIKLVNQIAKRVRVSNMRAAMASCNTPTPSTRREPSATERETVYHPYGYHLAACFHDKLYITPCQPCKRTAAMALIELEKLLRRIK